MPSHCMAASCMRSHAIHLSESPSGTWTRPCPLAHSAPRWCSRQGLRSLHARAARAKLSRRRDSNIGRCETRRQPKCARSEGSTARSRSRAVVRGAGTERSNCNRDPFVRTTGCELPRLCLLGRGHGIALTGLTGSAVSTVEEHPYRAKFADTDGRMQVGSHNHAADPVGR